MTGLPDVLESFSAKPFRFRERTALLMQPRQFEIEQRFPEEVFISFGQMAGVFDKTKQLVPPSRMKQRPAFEELSQRMIEEIADFDRQGGSTVCRADGLLVVRAHALKVRLPADVEAKQAFMPSSFRRLDRLPGRQRVLFSPAGVQKPPIRAITARMGPKKFILDMET